MVYQIDTPGLEDQAVTNDKIESGTIEINRLDSTLAGALVPVGGIIMWSGTLDQINGFPNWQLCDGSAIASGALSGTNTPNLTGRFVIGTNTYDTGQNRWEETITGSSNQTGGSKDAIVVSHDHTVSNDSHSHGNGTLSVDSESLSGSFTPGTHVVNTTGVFSDGGNVGSPETGDSSNGRRIDFNGTHDHTISGSTSSESTGITIDTEGSSGTNANLPPYYALAYIIRIS